MLIQIGFLSVVVSIVRSNSILQKGLGQLGFRLRQPRRAALIAATSIFFIPIIASNARFASSPPAAKRLG
jgi:hypothetical protein